MKLQELRDLVGAECKFDRGCDVQSCAQTGVNVEFASKYSIGVELCRVEMRIAD